MTETVAQDNWMITFYFCLAFVRHINWINIM